jgi:hypothetical protein
MVPQQNPHGATRWGFLFACLPILSAWVITCGGMLSADFSSRPCSSASSGHCCNPE